MIRPKTKILVDGGDPQETQRIKHLLGFVDGQTTNPSLIARFLRLCSRSCQSTRNKCAQNQQWRTGSWCLLVSTTVGQGM